MSESVPWWRRGVIYQLLVPTFFDTNGDGMGDLQGVRSKLEYLQWLGVDAVWLSPIFESPFVELGYDTCDYTSIYPPFGTLDDFDALLHGAHARQLKIILDWVPNHTSSRHPWFVSARFSRDDPKRSWYIWRDPKPDGSQPNNWLSVFGGSVWTFDEATHQYYLHTFLEDQPDLNWDNPAVQEAMLDAMRFWLDRGADGFRLDALDLLRKDPEFRDNPDNPNYNPDVDGPDMAVLPVHTRNLPSIHETVATMRKLVDEYGDHLLSGELYLPPDQLAAYYGASEPELHLPLNPAFTFMTWEAGELRDAIETYLRSLPADGWPSWMMSTHDGRRIASRAGADRARVAAMMLLTLSGTPIIYYGDEIGMHDVPVPPEKERDPQGKRIGRKRDPVRTPMQWNDWMHAGFTTGEPWLPVADDYAAVNVQAQSGGNSLLMLYRSLLALRREDRALHDGSCTLGAPQGPVISYRRDADRRSLLVTLNMSADGFQFDLADEHGKILLSTSLDRDAEPVRGSIDLRPNEGTIIELT